MAGIVDFGVIYANGQGREPGTAMKNNISHSRLSEIPKEERPYEKCRAFGAASLSDSELLAVLLRTGTRDKDALSLARSLKEVSKARPGLMGLFYCNYQELMRLRGIGPVKAAQFLCIAELSKRVARSQTSRTINFNDPETIAEYFMEDLRHKSVEELRALLLDSKNRLIHEQLISVGTVNMAPSSPREIYIHALSRGAVNIILIHNHPSGDPSPSVDDLSSTRRVKEAGELIGVSLLDHVIIGDNRYVSLREYTEKSERIW